MACLELDYYALLFNCNPIATNTNNDYTTFTSTAWDMTLEEVAEWERRQEEQNVKDASERSWCLGITALQLLYFLYMLWMR